MYLTILTPTWNRAHLLPRLYRSLSDACSGDAFVEWLVIDDGSTDTTAAIVAGWAGEARFPIRYACIEHGGKHRALNAGFEIARGEWIAIVDSDDWLLENGFGRMIRALDRAGKSGAEIAFLPMEVVGRERQYRFMDPGRATTIVERYADDVSFDCTLAFRKAIRDLRMPEVAGENFLAESALLFGLEPQTRVYLADEVCVAVEYQPDGLSSLMLEHRMASPVGTSLAHRRMSRRGLPPLFRLRALVNYGRFTWHALFAGRTPLQPKTLAQALFIPAGLPFAVIDLWRQKRRKGS